MGDYYCAGSLDTHVVFGIFVASLRAVGCATTLASVLFGEKVVAASSSSKTSAILARTTPGGQKCKAGLQSETFVVLEAVLQSIAKFTPGLTMIGNETESPA